jgi:catechol 2,3-dioxygenase-like lactoylglutathione lyase family enzyme
MAALLAGDSIDVGIVTTNEEAMIGFYNGVLGLPLAGGTTLPDGARIRRISCGRSVLRLYIPPAPVQPRPGEDWSAVAGLRYWAIRIDNLAAVVDDCRREGATIVQDVVEPRPGVSAALIADPDGNVIELMQIGNGKREAE